MAASESTVLMFMKYFMTIFCLPEEHLGRKLKNAIREKKYIRKVFEKCSVNIIGRVKVNYSTKKKYF